MAETGGVVIAVRVTAAAGESGRGRQVVRYSLDYVVNWRSVGSVMAIAEVFRPTSCSGVFCRKVRKGEREADEEEGGEGK
jgi:hypothetical protein